MKLVLLVLLLLPGMALAGTGWAVSFNGTYDWGAVEVMSAPATSTLTMECLVCPQSSTGSQIFLDFHSLYAGLQRKRVILYLAGGSLGAYVNANPDEDLPYSGVGLASLSNGTWYHVALVIANSSVTVYVNGEQVGTGGLDQPYSSDGDEAFSLGSDFWNSSYANVIMDEVRLWNVARSQAQIQGAMHGTLVGNEAGLFVFYPMNDGSGGTITDHQSNYGASNADLYSGLWVPFNGAPLPITLTTFAAATTANGTVLRWRTASETNNYGFFVQQEVNGTFVDLPGAFVAGHGTTIEQHTYEYALGSAAGTFRLRQADLDGTSHYSEPVQVAGVTSVAERVPTSFSLSQNFPNPFNPVTTIAYGLPQRSRVTMVVCNILGQQVREIVNGVVEAGVHQVRFDAHDLPSGAYLYRMQAHPLEGGKDFVESRRLLLVK